MGSFKHKINNKKQKKQEAIVVNELIELKKKMKEQYAAGEYVEAMDTMAKIADHKKMDPEVMFMGASCYFMTGDYERAVKWVNNTLTYDPSNVSARVLLGRLCFVEDKVEKGFEVLNFVVEKLQSGMKDSDRELLINILEYCHNNMPDMMNNYPLLVDYFKENYVAPAAPTAPIAPSIQDSVETSLSKAQEQLPEDGKTKAQAAVDRLKELLNKSKGKSQSIAPAAEAKETVNTNNAHIVIEDKKTAEKSAEISIKDIMDRPVSLKEKIQGLNNAAGDMFVNGDNAGAMALLKQALEIDAHDPFVLRNAAYVVLAMGDKAKALEYAKSMPMMDFALLSKING